MNWGEFKKYVENNLNVKDDQEVEIMVNLEARPESLVISEENFDDPGQNYWQKILIQDI